MNSTKLNDSGGHNLIFSGDEDLILHQNGSCAIREFDIASLIIQIVISSIIIFPNGAVVKVIFTGKSRLYQKPAYYFIASLAIADMSVAIYVIISILINDIAGIQMTALSWAIMYTCGSIPFYVSVLHLLLIAIDRLWFIGYNKIYQKYMSLRTSVLLILLCWMLSFTPIVVVLLGVGACGDLCDCPDDGVLKCSDFKCSSIFVVYKKTYLLGNVFFFLFVMVIICFLYATLFWKVHRKSQKVRGYCNPSMHQTQSRKMMREFRLARTLAIVILVFFACWGPLMIGYIIDFTLPFNVRIGETVGNLLSIPNLLNSISNPIIYAARMRHMREALIPCSKRSRDRKSSASSTGSTQSTKRVFLSKKKGARKNSNAICDGRPVFESSVTNNLQFEETMETGRRSSSQTTGRVFSRSSYKRGSDTASLDFDKISAFSPEFKEVFEDAEISI
ncbi:adenosine receptor A3-like [Styela clava]